MGGEPTGDTAGRQVVVQRVYGVREGKQGGSAMGVKCLVGNEWEQEAAKSRTQVR